jgi:cold-inducible RNA-binding protein
VGKKLYVGNLPFSASEEDLSAKFATCGTVESAKLITDRETGRSKGFGFVEMATDAEAQAAIDKLNGADYDGRPMTVNEARPQKKRPGPGGGGRGGYGGGNRW